MSSEIVRGGQTGFTFGGPALGGAMDHNLLEANVRPDSEN